MKTKKCSKCGVIKQVSEFYRRANGNLRGECKECRKKDDNKRYFTKYKNDPEYIKRTKKIGLAWYYGKQDEICAHRRTKDREIRENCIEYYGDICACCGENRYEFLVIDHINGKGGQHRKEIGGKIIRWLVKNNFPEGYRVLCHNCNASIGYYGYCPHDNDKKEATPLTMVRGKDF